MDRNNLFNNPFLTISDYVEHLITLNEYLKNFPEDDRAKKDLTLVKIKLAPKTLTHFSSAELYNIKQELETAPNFWTEKELIQAILIKRCFIF